MGEWKFRKKSAEAPINIFERGGKTIAWVVGNLSINLKSQVLNLIFFQKLGDNYEKKF